MTRDDREAEAARRNNAVRRAKPEAIFLADLPDATCDLLAARFAPRLRALFRRVHDSERIDNNLRRRFTKQPLQWGKDRIGLGLLNALRAGSDIIFEDRPSPIETIPPREPHLVVCEEGNEIAQVIAANYAYALGAGLCLIPAVEASEGADLLEEFYSLYDVLGSSQTDILEHLKQQLLDLCGPLSVPPGGSITFVTSGLPFGFAVSGWPSTHIFSYPQMGISVLNGFAAEQPGETGVGFVCLVDPTTKAHEIAAAETLLPPRGAFLRTYYGPGANVRHVTEMIELFPYDLLLISTHCGDPKGHRWTYQFRDSEGHDRTLIVDIALGIGRTDDPNILGVTQFLRFVSLDGVDWTNRKEKEALYVGTAIKDFMRMTSAKNPELKPVKKDLVDRVIGSAALKMFDDNFILLPKPLADEGTPIVINNACTSWHRLAETFTFCNARAYLGTLFPVTDAEAEEVVVKLLGKHHDKALPHALWSSQRDVYGDRVRRPYVVTGVYTQSLRVRPFDVARMIARLESSLAAYQKQFLQTKPEDESRYRAINDGVAYYQSQVGHFREVASDRPPPGPVVRRYTR